MAQGDAELLQAALLGYEAELKRVQQSIAEIQRRLGRRGGGDLPGPFSPGPKKQHRISAEGRARIAEAQRRRWAKAKKA